LNAFSNSGITSSRFPISIVEGEIGFFDFYIIPLAKKLKECGVFGVSSDEVRKLMLCVLESANWHVVFF
jgi:hypothetical protein